MDRCQWPRPHRHPTPAIVSKQGKGISARLGLKGSICRRVKPLFARCPWQSQQSPSLRTHIETIVCGQRSKRTRGYVGTEGKAVDVVADLVMKLEHAAHEVAATTNAKARIHSKVTVCRVCDGQDVAGGLDVSSKKASKPTPDIRMYYRHGPYMRCKSGRMGVLHLPGVRCRPIPDVQPIRSFSRETSGGSSHFWK